MFAFILTILGLLFGSFANVCIWRVPRGEEVVRTPSHCPQCDAAIRWYDNIPLFSFIALGGRCRACRAPIPWRYPLIEAASGALFLVLALRFGPDWRLLGYVPLAWALLVIAAIDIDHYIIPDGISVGGIAAGLALALAAVWFPPLRLSVAGFGWRLPAAPLMDSLAGIAAGGGLIAGAAWAGHRIYGQEAMGGGDIKLAAMIGAALGWQAALLAIFIALVTGSLGGGALLLLGKATDSRELQRTHFAGELAGGGAEVAPKPAVQFGPFLALGALAAVFCGRQLLGLYLGLFK